MFLTKNKKYYVSFEDNDPVSPEEILLDSGSEYSDIERPIIGLTLKFFLVIFIASAALILAFVFKISIIDHDTFEKLAFQNKSVNFSLPPPRGMILDRNNQALVKNIPTFNLIAISREIRGNGKDSGASIKKIAQILKRDSEEFIKFIGDQTTINSTFFVHLDLTKDQVLEIEYLSPKGFYAIPITKREYISSQKFSQVVGYTGKVSKEDLKDEYYFLTDTIGRLGVEAEYEEYLRGQHGNIFISQGESDYITKEASPGKSVVTNLDRDFQIKLYDETFAVLRDSGLARAVAIIQNPNNGEVLALVSFPDFDNNIFSSGVSEDDYERLFENKSKPLFNRAISGLYNPGSTIKPLMGMMALEEKIISPEDTITDCIGLTVNNPYNPSDSYTFNNWRVEYGSFNLKRAIANSCNIYFFTIGGGNGGIKGLGAEKIGRYLKSSLADSILGIDLPGEEKGFIPTPEWKNRKRGEPWYLGDTYNISIGQGDLSVTPLWLNSYISAIANGGDIYKPRVVNRINDYDNLALELKPQIMGSLPFSKETINQVREAMKETVISGTAQILKDLPVQVAAKTGTSEVIKGKTMNSIFTVFAPYENPQITLTVLIEGATSQQGLAIRVAHRFLKWYFSD